MTDDSFELYEKMRLGESFGPKPTNTPKSEKVDTFSDSEPKLENPQFCNVTGQKTVDTIVDTLVRK